MRGVQLPLGISAYRIAKEGGKGFAPATKYLDAVLAKCPDYHSDLHYTLGTMHYAEGRYAEAARAFAAFQRFPREDAARVSKNYDKQQKDVDDVMPELEFYTDFYRNTAPLNPKPLANVNTAADEYLPMLSPDNELLLFTRKRQVRAKGDLVARDIEELVQARRSDIKSDFDAGEALDEPFNTGDSYGGLTISVNNKEMFVTVGGPADARGYRNYDLHRSHYDTKFNLDFGGQEFVWNGLDLLPAEVNGTDTWESQPSLSGDGRTIYFATARANSRGMDIFFSTRDAKGEWSPAQPGSRHQHRRRREGALHAQRQPHALLRGAAERAGPRASQHRRLRHLLQQAERGWHLEQNQGTSGIPSTPSTMSRA
ncbi:MAG: PD40 domain-containing protein [Flavobacteriales bacterium]|nr:PD40 domain-containing protein [Flavobacteriales bacterium]